MLLEKRYEKKKNRGKTKVEDISIKYYKDRREISLSNEKKNFDNDTIDYDTDQNLAENENLF